MVENIHLILQYGLRKPVNLRIRYSNLFVDGAFERLCEIAWNEAQAARQSHQMLEYFWTIFSHLTAFLARSSIFSSEDGSRQAALLPAPPRLAVFRNVFAGHRHPRLVKRLECPILRLNGFVNLYSQVKWMFSTKMAQHKALVLFKLNSHAKMAPDKRNRHLGRSCRIKLGKPAFERAFPAGREVIAQLEHLVR